MAGAHSEPPLYQHFGPEKEHSTILNWYMMQLAYLLEQLAGTSEGDGTMLDSALVPFGSRIGATRQHSRFRVPRILFGGGKTFRLGRHVTYDNAPSNNLLVSIQNTFGIESDTLEIPSTRRDR